MTHPGTDPFEEAPPVRPGPLTVSLEGWEGPLDLLLELARDQKVDLARISVLRLAEQYLDWIARARALDLEIAADYLVMAAWLAYLKSRLLLPPAERPADEPSPEAAAEALAWQLRRLEAMREAGAALMARVRLGLDVWPRGAPEARVERVPGGWAVSLADLIAAYAAARRRALGKRRYAPPPLDLMSVQDALARLTRLLRVVPDWAVLTRFLPPNLAPGLPTRAGVASMLVAGLELAKGRALSLRQDEPFGPIWIKPRREPEPEA
ncbi:segregation and condensation protein A [Elioraea thermophila]|uniref:segregation and condensation protein A n=1 Tax=Elioraea thermophila TaxID=2185104 RepID=UPI000DF11C06|nr:ScpA family protein [Elioraea thermophila]